MVNDYIAVHFLDQNSKSVKQRQVALEFVKFLLIFFNLLFFLAIGSLVFEHFTLISEAGGESVLSLHHQRTIHENE